MLKLSCQLDCSSKFKHIFLVVLFSDAPEFLKLILKVGLSAFLEASRLTNDLFQ